MEILWKQSNIIDFALVFAPVELWLGLIEELNLNFPALLLERVLLLENEGLFGHNILVLLLLVLQSALLVVEIEVVLETGVGGGVEPEWGGELEALAGGWLLVGAFAGFLQGWIRQAAHIDFIGWCVLSISFLERLGRR